jgi:cellobiose-specific phosphotransferase system component IIC
MNRKVGVNKASLTAVAQRMPQRTRRVVAVASLLGLPASYAWYALWSGSTVPKAVWGPFGFALLLVSALGAFFLYAFAGDRATRSNKLDERQRQLRDRAWTASYAILSVFVAAAVVAASVVVLVFDRTITLDGRVMSAVATCFGILVPVLPAAALAWLEPDPPAED